ncbi:sperm-tail PG-rich repeat-containing protein 2-like [Ylistrum balloti]|uniref:sperm-tail PG-rich repeat-containing protein 2-like n=1 Tax=Ylistrum balloti TaxID=509963 RepID=UPI002905A6A3|nr:sperm-tail PG-rich repeat-containing protein 2-like [Ylistrum balloti]
MYDRAPRDLVALYGSTPHNVGPGSYDAGLSGKGRVKADGYAPFLSMTSRDGFFNVRDQVVAAPGPGHYDPAQAQDTIKGGKTLANKSKRFGDSVTDNPGPGTYSVDKYTEFRTSKSAPVQGSKDKAGALLTSRIKFHRKPEAPSIPMSGQAYGYEECDDGTLKKQAPPDRDVSLGPAFYKPSNDETKSTKNYKGVHFGKQTSKRLDLSMGRQGPGPGEYEPYRELVGKPENMNAEEPQHVKFEARIPRYHEAIVKDEEKKAVPGPGKYDSKGLFDPEPPKLNTEGIEVEHPPFMSQSKRFTPLKAGNPSPGSYNDPRNAFESTKRITGLKRSPFGQTSVRFGPNQVQGTKKVPGPGAYNITGMGSDSMRKAYIESTRKGVFGTTSVRIKTMTKKDEVEIPGPAHYQVKEKPFKNRYPNLSSTFASVTSRLTEQPSVIKELPPPGSYEVQNAYEKSQIKRDRIKPRTENAKRKQGSFLSAASRFAPPRDVVITQNDPENPGPGAYQHQEGINKKGGLMVTKDKRFKEIKAEGPGPGSYEFSPLVQDTVLQGTFNATLNNPIAAQVDTAIHATNSAKHAFLLGV